MKTKTFTLKQINKFLKFCKKHNIQFGSMAEYQGALYQFYLED